MPFAPGQSGNPTGRPKGIADKRIAKREEIFKEIALRLHHDLSGRAANATAHDVLVAIYRHPDATPDMRMEAARIAIRYEMPSLQATQVSGSVEINLSVAERLTNARKRLDTHTGPTIDLLPAQSAASMSSPFCEAR